MTKKLSEHARRISRAYRNGPIRIGHSSLRRFLHIFMPNEQEIQLRSGLKLRLDLSKANENSIFWHDGDIDIRQYWAIRELVPIGGVFVDCGANFGLMGFLARQYHQAKVVLIEPHPGLAKKIAANIQLNEWNSNCEIIDAAISDASGEINFFEDSKTEGSHAIQPDPKREKDFVPLGKVRCLTLSEIVESHSLSKIHYLKIDTEGNELAALKGLRQYLRPSFIEVIYVEMLQNQSAIRDLMTSNGYIGFAPKPMKRRQMIQLQKHYEKGGQAAFFEPLNETSVIAGDVLWCGKDSAVADLLNAAYKSGQP